jgi:RsiW-degrading membrane proteinase PrsW (M82 family)
MESMALWEKLLLGALVVLVLLWFRPGLKAAFKERRNASREEWMSLLVPIALVAGFVVLLMMLV